MSWHDNKEYYEQLARKIEPSVKLVTKDHWVWHAIAWLLYWITFTAFKRKTFLETYATTLGPIQAYPRRWKVVPETLIIHESRHTTQFRVFGFGISAWIGIVPMGILYLLVLPLGFSPFRFLFELDANYVEYKYMRKYGVSFEHASIEAERNAKNIVSYRYGWSLPSKKLSLAIYRWAVKRAYC